MAFSPLLQSATGGWSLQLDSEDGVRAERPGAAEFCMLRWETAVHNMWFWFSAVWRLKPAPAAPQEPCCEHREELWGWDQLSPVGIQLTGGKLSEPDKTWDKIIHTASCCISKLNQHLVLISGWAMVPGTHWTSSTGATRLSQRVHSCARAPWAVAQPQGMARYLQWKPRLLLCALRLKVFSLSRTRKRDLC